VSFSRGCSGNSSWEGTDGGGNGRLIYSEEMSIRGIVAGSLVATFVVFMVNALFDHVNVAAVVSCAAATTQATGKGKLT
jgi:hypothetical protein